MAVLSHVPVGFPAITKGRKIRETELIEVPYMAVSNVKDGYIDWTTLKTIMATKQEIEQYRLLPYDVLMTEGGNPDKLGRGSVITKSLKNSIHQNHNVFALISAVCGEEELYPISVGIAPFWQRTRTFIIVDSIILGVASLFLIVPPLRAAIRKRKSRLKKEQRKQARREKLRSGNGQ